MRLYLSDLHLEDPSSRAFHTFAHLLQSESVRAEAIYILGDLCEVWVGDDDDGPMASGLRAVLRDAASRSAVHVMHGNRDFLFGERFAAETGIHLLKDPWLLDDGTLLSHGDAFCVDDAAYQQVRALFRSPDWQRDILSRDLAARRELARGLRQQSRDANANKAVNIMDVADAAVAEAIVEHGARRLIHGHTHRPGRHRYDWGCRYVLGAWEGCGWIARQSNPGEEPVLECIALKDR